MAQPQRTFQVVASDPDYWIAVRSGHVTAIGCVEAGNPPPISNGDASLALDQELAQQALAQLHRRLRNPFAPFDMPLRFAGTDLQRAVWRALQEIPVGETRTYSQLAETIGRPLACRAVAQACARNQHAFVVPCHRIVRSDGGLGGYAWGIERKKALLQIEQEAIVHQRHRQNAKTA